MTVQGTVAAGFESVRDGFGEGQASDNGGAQLCIYRHGRKVVDLWTGRDRVKDRPYTDETLTLCFSVSKGATATMAHMLAERGLIDYDAPVAKYWPEFAAHGKSKITVSDLLAHRAGLNSFDPDSDMTVADFASWKRCVDALAAMEPLWEPGSAFAYHAITYGYLVGEVIRRVTGKMPGVLFAEEVARPLGLELWIGLPAGEEARVAPHYRPDRPAFTPEQIAALLSGFGIDGQTRNARAFLKTFSDVDDAVAFLNSREGHAAEIPAGNMIGTAASLARMYAAIIGDVDGVRLLKDETVRGAMRIQTEGLTAPGDFARFPVVSPHRYGLGYQLTRMAAPMLGEGSFGHDGAGGRIGFAHPESGIAVGYVGNHMLWDGMGRPDDRWLPWTQALCKVIGMDVA